MQRKNLILTRTIPKKKKTNEKKKRKRKTN